MSATLRRLVVSFFVPYALVLLAAVAVVRLDLLPLGRAPLREFFALLVYAAGAMLAVRFRSSRVLISLLVIVVAQEALVRSPAGATRDLIAALVALFVPAHLLFTSTLEEKGLTAEALVPRAWFAGVQLALGAGCAYFFAEPALRVLRAQPLPAAWLDWTLAPQPAVLLAGVTIFFCGIRYVREREPLDAAALWACVASWLAIDSGSVPTAAALLNTAALMLPLALIEKSYAMAYVDELTQLPARRAFNEALHTVRVPYVVAIADVDHFKSFNDRYGHETGDHVLRMVAGKLAEVGGGGKAFRNGGEEFAIVFAGKTLQEAAPYAELVRQAIAATEFTVRGISRRATPRAGADRRQLHPGSPARDGGGTLESVTVSIGLAEARPGCSTQEVVEAADAALYSAKNAGRNRVEVGRMPRRAATAPAG